MNRRGFLKFATILTASPSFVGKDSAQREIGNTVENPLSVQAQFLQETIQAHTNKGYHRYVVFLSKDLYEYYDTQSLIDEIPCDCDDSSYELNGNLVYESPTLPMNEDHGQNIHFIVCPR